MARTYEGLSPIKKGLKLDHSYIEILSDIRNLNNGYIVNDSQINVKTSKNFGDDNFVTSVNLTNSEINLAKLGVFKKKSIPSRISMTILFDQEKQLHLKDLN